MTVITSNNCATFTDCISKISNIELDNAKDIFEVMPIRV